MQSLFSLDWYSPVKRLTKWTTKRASRSLERRVLQLEERPVLLDGRPRGGVVREAPGDEAVRGAAAEGVQGGQGGVHPGLGHAKAGVDERARHGEVWGGRERQPAMDRSSKQSLVRATNGMYKIRKDDIVVVEEGRKEETNGVG